MIGYPLRILPVAIFVIFLLSKGLCRKAHKKTIILENEEDVIVFTKNGSSLRVKCHYSGDFDIVDVKWKKIKDNEHVEVSPNEILTTSQWLDLENVSLDDEGQYSCTIISSEENSQKSGFILKTTTHSSKPWVEKIPNFQKDFKEDVSVLVNRTLHLNCPFTSMSDTTFYWYKNNNDLLITREAKIEGVGAIDNEYSLKPVRMSDAGIYKCVVENEYGSIEFQFAVAVYEDEIKSRLNFEYPRDLSLRSGNRAFIFCQAFDYGDKEIDWYFLNSTNPVDVDMETMDLSQFKKMVNNNDVVMLDGKLVIEPVTIQDAGWYICIKKGFERILMAEAKLNVNDTISMKVNSEVLNQDENVSDDKHFLLSLLPMLSKLPMDKKLIARIAIETSLQNIAFPDLRTVENYHTEPINTTQQFKNLTESL
ncbi:fibroblast growth factor receptor 3-like [Myzus persicae]|uniref:fibroblast growth factor receptor 3-like n=1 Tax=Myzus persicae TaxID=13164 RepID=UPI000B936470|nr:fibroblast growth factor receptor 3-like [Myzus persicae]XP_022170712.1 fibroblast growth factor receptor 3-like [Myzus persicae]